MIHYSSYVAKSGPPIPGQPKIINNVVINPRPSF